MSVLLFYFYHESKAQKDTIYVVYKEASDSGQSISITDTIPLNERYSGYVLSGTCLLPRNGGQINLCYRAGFDIEKVSRTECRGNNKEFSQKDIVQGVIETDTSLTIELKVTDNCCYNFICDVELADSDVINLKYIGYGSFCSCNCCFGLTWNFRKTPLDEAEDQIRARYIMLNGDRKQLIKLPDFKK